MNTAILSILEDAHARKHGLVLLDERRVTDPNWEPREGTPSFAVMRILAQGDGVQFKNLASQLGKTSQSSYRAIVPLQDAGLVVNIRKVGYVLTSKGVMFAKKKRIKVTTTKAFAQSLPAADLASKERKLPQDIRATEEVIKALGRIASTSALGKRTRGTRLGDIGFAYKKMGASAEWTATLKGSAIGAQFTQHTIFLRNKKQDIQILTNGSMLNLTPMTHALQVAGITGVGSIQVIGWQGDASLGDDDVVVSFMSDAIAPPAAPKVDKRAAARARMRMPARMVKRSQALLKRAAKSGRLGSVSRALKIAKGMQ